jgi:hemolysin III
MIGENLLREVSSCQIKIFFEKDFMSKHLREPFNGLSHLVGAVAAFFAQIALLVVSWPVAAKVVSVLIYGISLIALFSASATYHLAKVKPGIQQVLRKFDHSAIYLLIAGTYTPFCINAFTGFFRWGLLSVIWAIALIGIIINIFYINAPRWLSAGVYVVMGWLCVSAIGQMSALPVSSIVWMLIGGIIYTLGAVIYATKIFNFVPGKFGFHEVWHIFVLLGAAAHFVAVLGVITRTG